MKSVHKHTPIIHGLYAVGQVVFGFVLVGEVRMPEGKVGLRKVIDFRQGKTGIFRNKRFIVSKPETTGIILKQGIHSINITNRIFSGKVKIATFAENTVTIVV
ncbi:hypothetical protein DSECCO2_611940 [anaerobic digester metagenome]